MARPRSPGSGRRSGGCFQNVDLGDVGKNARTGPAESDMVLPGPGSKGRSRCRFPLGDSRGPRLVEKPSGEPPRPNRVLLPRAVRSTILTFTPDCRIRSRNFEARYHCILSPLSCRTPGEKRLDLELGPPPREEEMPRGHRVRGSRPSASSSARLFRRSPDEVGSSLRPRSEREEPDPELSLDSPGPFGLEPFLDLSHGCGWRRTGNPAPRSRPEPRRRRRRSGGSVPLAPCRG